MRLLTLVVLLGCSREAPRGDRPLAFQCGSIRCGLECPTGDRCTEAQLVACRRPPNESRVDCYVTLDACRADVLVPGECHLYSVADYLAR